MTVASRLEPGIAGVLVEQQELMRITRFAASGCLKTERYEIAVRLTMAVFEGEGVSELLQRPLGAGRTSGGLSPFCPVCASVTPTPHANRRPLGLVEGATVAGMGKFARGLPRRGLSHSTLTLTVAGRPT